MSAPAAGPQQWPGRRLGLPEQGPRSIARFGRRLAALAIDYVPAVLLSIAFFDYSGFANLGLFALLQIVPIWLLGGSIGHLILRIRVVPVTGGRLAWWRPIVRTALLCLVIPAVIWNRDQRGVHDMAAGTMMVRI